MQRTYIKDLAAHAGEEVTIKGWVDVRRDQGKMIFFDFRDVTGKVQGVILPNAKAAHEVGSKLRPEWVVEVRGREPQGRRRDALGVQGRAHALEQRVGRDRLLQEHHARIEHAVVRDDVLRVARNVEHLGDGSLCTVGAGAACVCWRLCREGRPSARKPHSPMH